MIVTKELIAKGALGTAAVAATAGTTYLYKDQIFGSSRSETVIPELKITKFDKALVDFLGAGGDIKFKVLKSVSGTTDEELQVADLILNNANTSVTVKVTVSTTGDNNALVENTENAEGKKQTLVNINKGTNEASGTDWTWTCEIKLTKKSDAIKTVLNDDEKGKLMKNSAEGLFNKLKGDAEKELKKKFIKNCSEAREDAKNKIIDALEKLDVTSGAITSANTLESLKEFKLRDNKDNETADKLYFDDKAEFTKWFETAAVES